MPQSVKGACECRICGAPADLTEVGIYVCQESASHVADRFTGSFTDLSIRSRTALGKLAAP